MDCCRRRLPQPCSLILSQLIMRLDLFDPTDSPIHSSYDRVQPACASVCEHVSAQVSFNICVWPRTPAEFRNQPARSFPKDSHRCNIGWNVCLTAPHINVNYNCVYQTFFTRDRKIYFTIHLTLCLKPPPDFLDFLSPHLLCSWCYILIVMIG